MDVELERDRQADGQTGIERQTETEAKRQEVDRQIDRKKVRGGNRLTDRKQPLCVQVGPEKRSLKS